MCTVYRSVCGCLVSPPEPSWSEYPDHAEYDSAWDRWNDGWKATIHNHHSYCCQELQQSKHLSGCLVGEPGTCPHLMGS